MTTNADIPTVSPLDDKGHLLNVELISAHLVAKLRAYIKNCTCDRCGLHDPGIDVFAALFRTGEVLNGRPDPGNLCGTCARLHHEGRVAAELQCLPILNR